MRLKVNIRRAIAQALEKQCHDKNRSCPVEDDCPFSGDCHTVRYWHWEKALGSVKCKEVKEKKDDAGQEDAAMA